MAEQQGTTMMNPVLLSLTALIALIPFTAVAGTPFPELNPPVQYRDFPESQTPAPGRSSKSGSVEWVYHRTEDGLHPSGMEQQQVWFVNRARFDPTAEGVWLATETDFDVSWGRDWWRVNPDQLAAEFAAITPKPPVAFDRRLYEAALKHSEDLIERDAQDHEGQFDEVDRSGFIYRFLGGVVYSWSLSGLNAHAGFNIDWGPSDAGDGMQDPRGHRITLMAIDYNFANVGIASVPVDPGLEKDVGPFVTTGNYAEAHTGAADHFNTFIVGTVWTDLNKNERYDPGEGIGDIAVTPNVGSYYAVSSNAGGYAVPFTVTGSAAVTFSGGNLFQPLIFATDLGSESVPLNLILREYYLDADDDGYGDASVSTLFNSQPEGYSFDKSDCDDGDRYEYPGQTWYKDADDDGYSDGTIDTESCIRPDGFKAAGELVSDDIDCDDGRFDIYPGAVEQCDGVDNNCDSVIDEGVLLSWFRDSDGDGFGNPDSLQNSCDFPADHIADNTDCDDDDFYAFPGQIWYKDADGDGYSDGTTDTKSCIRPYGYKAADELKSITGDENDDDDSIFPSSGYVLTVKISGNIQGSVTSDPAGIDCEGVCSEKFGADQPVILTARILEGKGTVLWNHPACDDEYVCEVQMTDDMELSVEFQKKFPWTMFFPVFTGERIK